MTDFDSLICAFALDGKGGGKALEWADIKASEAGDGLVWIHLHREADETRRWLFEDSGIPAIVCEALLAAESRPRCSEFPEGLLLDLRGVNLNPGADPEDMVAIRVWFEAGRIVSVRRRKLQAIDQIRAGITRGGGPKDAGSFLCELANRLVLLMGTVIGDLDDTVDELEDTLLTAENAELRRDLRDLRRQAIALRRYIGPNREALTGLLSLNVDWVEREAQHRLREVSDRITRLVEEIDTARERAAVIQDEIASRISESMNRNMYLLAIIAGVFLPLSLLTGLLGINVSGIPGEKWEWSFVAVCGLLVALAGLEVWMMKRVGWL